MKESYFHLGNDDYLKVESDFLDDYVKLINKKNIKNIVLNEVWGYTRNDVEFLGACTGIEKLSIVKRDVDISPVKNCSELRTLFVEATPREKISFELFPNLEHLSFVYSPNWIELKNGAKRLTSLEIWKYSRPNLDELVNLQALKKLTITESKLESLEYIDRLTSLEKLHVAYSRQFTHVGSNAGNSNLRQIHLESTKKFTDYEGLTKFPNVEEIILMNSGTIRDVFFTERLAKLHTLTLTDVTIENGDIEVLKRLPELAFDQKKHYSFNLRDHLMQRHKLK